MKTPRCIEKLTLMTVLTLLLLTWLLPAAAAEPAYNGNEWAVLLYVNKHRMANGLRPLGMIPRLQTAARIRARELVDMVNDGKDIDHVRPDGRGWNTVLEENGFIGPVPFGAGENLAAGPRSAYEAFSFWRMSPGHNQTMLGGMYHHLGCGYAEGAKYHTNYALIALMAGCEFQGLRLVLPDTPLAADPDTTMESLGIKVVATCAVHGDTYMPLIAEMCAPDAFSHAFQQQVTVTLEGHTAGFVVNEGSIAWTIEDLMVLIDHMVEDKPIPDPQKANPDGLEGVDEKDLQFVIDRIVH